MVQRSVPLIVIASASAEYANEVAARLRRQGNIVYVTHSPEGCLRVATSVAPDMVLIDPAFPQRVERLLRAHPGTAQTQVLHLTRDSGVSPTIHIAHAA